MKRILSVLAVVLAIMTTLFLQPVNARGKYIRGSMKWDNLRRSYLLYVPGTLDRSQAVPLVIVLHGGGGTSRAMQKLTNYGFEPPADRDNFIVVYPNGIGRMWNDGRKMPRRSNADDVGFITALIDQLAKKYKIDKKRVYCTGASNGAKMSYRLACERTDKFAAIAAVISPMTVGQASGPKPSGPISVLIMNGTGDPLAPYNGGDMSLMGKKGKLGTVISTVDTVKYWVKNNRCSSRPRKTTLQDKYPGDGTRVYREVYGRGKNGTEVVLYRIEGGGHTWPRGPQYLREKHIGKVCKDIDGCEVIWEFFKRQRKK